MKSRRGSIKLHAFSMAIVAALSGTPAFATPACEVKPQVSPQNQTVSEGVHVQLNGHSSKDADSYFWEQVSGPTVTLADPTSDKPSFEAPEVEAAGVALVFKLTVTGCSGVSKSITTTVNVVNVADPNRPPTAVVTATPNTVLEGDIVTLDGTKSTDPDSGDVLTYGWTQLSGTAVMLTPDSSGATATFKSPNVGPGGESLAFRLTVTDKGGLVSYADAVVTVQWVNAPPVALAICFKDVNEGDDVALDGSGSKDEDDGIAMYAWSQLLGPPSVDLSAVFSSAAITFEAPHLGYHQDGKLPFKLTVTDTGGLSSSDECMVTIHDVTPPTIAGAVDKTAEATSASGAVVEFAPTAYDAVDGDVAVSCDPPSGSTFPLGPTAVSCSAADMARNEAKVSFNITIKDTTPPVIAPHLDVTALATSAAGASVSYGYPATTDLVDGAGTAECLPAEGSFPVGITTVTCMATDKAGNPGISQSFNVWVQYVWDGFFKPVDNVPVVNAVRAGSAIPLKFSLGVSPASAGGLLAATQFSNMGLDIFATGYPRAAVVTTSDLSVQVISDAETVTAGSSSLTYDSVASQYMYVWKTDKAWAGGSRQLQIKLKDGTIHTANFKFAK